MMSADEVRNRKGSLAMLIVVLAIVLVAVVWMSNWDRDGQPPGSPKETLKIGIGYQRNLIYLPVFVAYEKGFFKKENVEATLTVFPSAEEMLLALKTNQIEFTGMSSLSVVAKTEAETPGVVKLVTLEQFSPTASPDAIVVRRDSNIRALADLRGKKIGTWKGSTIEAYMKVILESAGVSSKKVNIIPMTPPEIENLFKAGQIDAAFTFEPSVARLVKDADARILERAPLANHLMGRAMTIYPGGGVVLSQYASSNPAAVQAFRRAYKRAVDFIDSNWSESMTILEKYGPGDVAVLGKLGRMSWKLAEPADQEDIQLLFDFYYQHKVIDKQISTESILSQ